MNAGELLKKLSERAERLVVEEIVENLLRNEIAKSFNQWDEGIDPDEIFDDEVEYYGPHVEVVRKADSGQVVDYAEVTDECATSSAAVLSFDRKIDPKNIRFTGSSGGAPFLPGGMEEDLAEEQKDPNDFRLNPALEEYKTCRSISALTDLKSAIDDKVEALVDPQIDDLDVRSVLLENADEHMSKDLLSLMKLSEDFDWLTFDEAPVECNLNPPDQSVAVPSAHQEDKNLDDKKACEQQIVKALKVDLNDDQIDQVSRLTEKTFTPKSTAIGGDYKWAKLIELANNVPEFEQLRPRMARTYPFELDSFQKEAIVHLEQGESVFIAAHTSAGKTVVAEYAIALCQRHNTRAVYTSPIKALSNQKFRDFKELFGDVGLITGDVQLNQDASCLIMTTEILRSMLYNGSEVVRELEWVIFDEVHYVNDPERGVVWEEVIIMLPDHVKIILLSATVDDILEFADWIGRIKQRNIYVMKTLRRPVPLEHFLYTGKDGLSKNELFFLVNRDGKFLTENYEIASRACSRNNETRMLVKNPYQYRENFKTVKNRWHTLIRFLEEKDLLPMVAFVFSRKSCDTNAEMLSSLDLTNGEEKSKVHRFFQQTIARLNASDRLAPQIQTIQEMCKRGVAVHHGGVLPIMKEAVEIMFQQSLVKILFATETFAMGVNMPARTVVFGSVEKHDGKVQRLLNSGEYTQMAGRAGRRGLDKTGTVIILCKGMVPLKDDLKNMILGNPPKIESRFRLTYNMMLNLFRAQPITPEMMLGKSYVENISFRSVRLLHSEILSLDKQLSRVQPVKCYYCTSDNSTEKYYELLMEVYDSATDALRSALENIEVGTVALVQKMDLFYFAILLKSYTFSGDINVEALIPNARVASTDLKSKKDYCWWRLLCLAGMLSNFAQLQLNTYSIVELAQHEIAYVSPFRIDISRKRVEEDWRRTRFKCSPGAEMLQFLGTLPPIAIAVFNEFSKSFRPILNNDKSASQRSKIELQCSQLRNFKCVRCPSFADHFFQFYTRMQMKKRKEYCDQELHRQTLRLLPEYENRLQVLRHFKYIDEFCIVQLPGKVAASINQHPLLFTQLLLENEVGNMTPDQLASMLSATSCQHKSRLTQSTENESLLPIKQLLCDMQKKIRQVEVDCKLSEADIDSELNFNLMQVVQSWALGVPFCELMSTTDAQEGIVVRCIQRVHEACRDLKTASCLIGDPNLMKLVEDTLMAIRRDIVFTTSLYIE